MSRPAIAIHAPGFVSCSESTGTSHRGPGRPSPSAADTARPGAAQRLGRGLPQNPVVKFAAGFVPRRRDQVRTSRQGSYPPAGPRWRPQTLLFPYTARPQYPAARLSLSFGALERTSRCDRPSRAADGRAAHRLHGESLQHPHPQPEAVDGGVPPVPKPVVPSTPDGDSTPTLDLSTVPLSHRLENQRPRGSPLTAAAHESTCQDGSYDLMIDPMTTGTVQRPSADLRRPRGREALSTHPPLLTTRPGGASNNGRRTHRPPQPSSPLKPPTPGRRRPGPGANQRPSVGATLPPPRSTERSSPRERSAGRRPPRLVRHRWSTGNRSVCPTRSIGL